MLTSDAEGPADVVGTASHASWNIFATFKVPSLSARSANLILRPRSLGKSFPGFICLQPQLFFQRMTHLEFERGQTSSAATGIMSALAARVLLILLVYG